MHVFVCRAPLSFALYEVPDVAPRADGISSKGTRCGRQTVLEAQNLRSVSGKPGHDAGEKLERAVLDESARGSAAPCRLGR